MRIDSKNANVAKLLEAIGTPYHWAKGDLKTVKWLDTGYDCSGFAQAALWAIGILKQGVWVDITAAGLKDSCDAIKPEESQAGDLFFYGSPTINHVTVALGGGQCIGANGGGSGTKGDDPKACVQVRPYQYRADFVATGRLKAKFRVS